MQKRIPSLFDFSFLYKKHKLRTSVNFTGVGLLFLDQIFYIFLQKIVLISKTMIGCSQPLSSLQFLVVFCFFLFFFATCFVFPVNERTSSPDCVQSSVGNYGKWQLKAPSGVLAYAWQSVFLICLLAL